MSIFPDKELPTITFRGNQKITTTPNKEKPMQSTTPSHFSTTLTDFLKEHEITQTKLSIRSNVNRSQITQYCNNQKRPGLDSIIKISDGLELITGIKSMKISVLFIRALRKDIKKGGMTC